jgi:hypothetical protein
MLNKDNIQCVKQKNSSIDKTNPSIYYTTIKCRNYEFCNKFIGKSVYNISNGLCIDCFFNMGKHKIINIFEKCSFCSDIKYKILLDCGHEICNNCWYNKTKNGIDFKNYEPICPLCCKS